VTNGILPNLLELAKDPKWRVRKTVVDKMGMLSKCLGVKVFEKKLQPVVIASLSDHVYAIRERACVQVRWLSCACVHSQLHPFHRKAHRTDPPSSLWSVLCPADRSV
jgi:hypothetical protein